MEFWLGTVGLHFCLARVASLTIKLGSSSTVWRKAASVETNVFIMISVRGCSEVQHVISRITSLQHHIKICFIASVFIIQ